MRPTLLCCVLLLLHPSHSLLVCQMDLTVSTPGYMGGPAPSTVDYVVINSTSEDGSTLLLDLDYFIEESYPQLLAEAELIDQFRDFYLGVGVSSPYASRCASCDSCSAGESTLDIVRYAIVAATGLLIAFLGFRAGPVRSQSARVFGQLLGVGSQLLPLKRT